MPVDTVMRCAGVSGSLYGEAFQALRKVRWFLMLCTNMFASHCARLNKAFVVSMRNEDHSFVCDVHLTVNCAYFYVLVILSVLHKLLPLKRLQVP